jgi:hypothetical protein
MAASVYINFGVQNQLCADLKNKIQSRPEKVRRKKRTKKVGR